MVVRISAVSLTAGPRRTAARPAPDRFGRELQVAAARLAFTPQILRSWHRTCKKLETCGSFLASFYASNISMSTDNSKFIREHSASLKDLFITRRQFLQRAGMGFGALSLATLLG